MDDWTKEPFKSEPTAGEVYHRNRVLLTKKTLDFISKHPRGVTKADFEKAGVRPFGIERLQKFKQIAATQIREPERGPRCYRWLFKPKKRKD